ncbi:MAG: DUF2721 domain-containing protein [Bacteroidota bacterium]
MQITSFATPALLFPAISLLILAYTNKFLAIANLIRKLHSDYEKEQRPILREQIVSLRRRVLLIRSMQTFAIGSFFLCFICMFFLFLNEPVIATWVFGASLVSMIISLVYSFLEIKSSASALKLLLKEFEE